MIRRPPSQLPMTDIDVQQVRDALARQKTEAAEAAKKKQGDTTAPGASNSSTAPANQPYHHVDEAKKKRSALSKEQRLGVR
ncbi:hypothetical protein BD413DRAFT_282044 [Trametes elegans]|nr:hypothetical protein BD413DRAFT_282044 [Trametes elegans]